MNDINCILVEDKTPLSDEFIYMVNKYNDFKILEICRDEKQALSSISTYIPDVVFLDIDNLLINVMELSHRIMELNKNIKVIFTSSNDNHALKAFEVGAFDYILKPVDEIRFYKTINRIRNEKNKEIYTKSDLLSKLLDHMQKLDKEEKLIKRIPCHEIDRIILINTEDIYYFYVEEDKTYAKALEKSYLTKYTLSELEQKTNFFRCHKSYLINSEKILELSPWFNGTYQLTMGDKENSLLPLSRSNVKKLKFFLGIC